MEIIEKMKKHDLWLEFMEYKLSRGDMKKKDCRDLQNFVINKEYTAPLLRLEKTREMSLPHLIEVNKNGVERKRQVFSFSREENYILKMMAYLLKDYDNIFCDNLYSFRCKTGVRKAIGRIRGSLDLSRTYSYKVDIHDYFNSINPEEMLEILKENLPEEKWLYGFFCELLMNPYAIKNGKAVKMKKGVMAGTPTANFLANLYMKDLDEMFRQKGVLYARYSDDIILFGESHNEIEEYETDIKRYLKEKGLEVNPRKEMKTLPGQKIEFLGFEFSPHQINISDMTEKKVKGKIKRKARALYRWKIRKDAGDERTVRAMIRFLNHKFYHNTTKGEITWCRWYFPLITQDDKLKKIDEYAVNSIRYLHTGRYGKKNYDLTYQEIKSMGFKSLVNAYWKYKKGLLETEDEET